jgi:N-acetylmuramoyl-L-alanine amidase
VIDAGHGGDETGARGAKGTLEKDVTLAVARRLRAAIEARLGVRVLMTRDDDRTVPLDERAALANNNKADLFLSIHANASVRDALAGAEVFHLGAERYTEDAQREAESTAVAMPVFGGGTREIGVIPWDTAQAQFVERSSIFAGFVEEALRRTVPMSPRALQQAPFRVLVGANMPAALVEVGYLSNPEQERQLASGEYQGRLAQALLEAIVRFDARVRSAQAAAPSLVSEGASR